MGVFKKHMPPLVGEGIEAALERRPSPKSCSGPRGNMASASGVLNAATKGIESCGKSTQPDSGFWILARKTC